MNDDAFEPLHIPTSAKEVDPDLRFKIMKLFRTRSEHPSGFTHLNIVEIAANRIQQEHPTIERNVAEKIGASLARTYVKTNMINGQLQLHENDGGKYPKRYRPGPERMSSYLSDIAKQSRSRASA